MALFKVTTIESGLSVGISGRLAAQVPLIGAVWWMAMNVLDAYEIQEWLWEMWPFVKQIIPRLIVGVFLAGMARAIIPRSWIEILAGRNTVRSNLVDVLFGVFMYFPTLVEVPIARMFLSLGMHRGVLLACLLADPELSPQSILITNSVIGRKNTAVYFVPVTIFSTLARLLLGSWLEGKSAWAIAGVLAGSIALLAMSAVWTDRRSRRRDVMAPEAGQACGDRCNRTPSTT